MKKLLDQDKIDIVNKYSGKSTVTQLAKEYNVNYSTIRSILVKRGIKIVRKNKYQLLDSYFEKIDSFEKAYFLGYLYADATITDSGSVTLEIQIDDKFIVERLSKIIYGFEKFYLRKKRKPNWKDMVSFKVYSKKMVSDLTSLGCTPRKSFTIRFPDESLLPKEYIMHFIRGYFDGDGGFHVKSTDKKGKVEISSNPNFCNDLCKILKNYDIKSYSYERNRGGNRKIAGSLQIFDRQSIKRFFDCIYDNATLFLERKKIPMLNYLNEIDKRYFMKYKIIAPDEKIFEVDNIEKFCSENHIYPNVFFKVVEGERKSVKGYKGMRFEDNEPRWKEKRGKAYKIIKPDGEIVEIFNLSNFCKENNLEYGKMITVLVGKSSNHKGYKCIRDGEDKPRYIDKRPERSLNIAKAIQRRYKIFFKNGDIKEIVNLNKFCKENNYNIGTVYQVKNGHRPFHKDIIGFEKLN